MITKSASSYKPSPENTYHYPLLSPPTESFAAALTQRLVAEHTWAAEWTLPSANPSTLLTMWPLTAFQWWAIALLVLLISGLVAVIAFLKLQKKPF